MHKGTNSLEVDLCGVVPFLVLTPYTPLLTSVLSQKPQDIHAHAHPCDIVGIFGDCLSDFFIMDGNGAVTAA